MPEIMNLLVGVASSLIAALLIFLVTPFFSKRIRWIWIIILGRLVGVKIEEVFKTQEEAKSDVLKELKQSSKIKIFVGRGREFQEAEYADIFKSQAKDIKILLPNVVKCSDECKNINWVEVRSNELGRIEEHYKIDPKHLQRQIEESVKVFQSRCPNNLKYYCVPHIGRIIITDDYAYWTAYTDNSHGKDTQVVKYRSSDNMYKFLERYFDLIWEKDSIEFSQTCKEEKQSSKCAVS